MSNDLKSVIDELHSRERSNRSRDQSPYIREQLARRWSDDEARTLRGYLIAELHRFGHHDEALTLLLAEVERDPQEPFHSICLAEHFHYFDVDLPRALAHIEDAIRKARSDGKFLYQALGVQARLAIEAERWSLLEATLHELTLYEHAPGKVDVFPETDFLALIPPGVVSDSSVSTYLDRVRYLKSVGYSTLTGPSRAKT